MPRHRASPAEGAATPLSRVRAPRVAGDAGRAHARGAPLVLAALLWPALAGAQVTATGDYLERMDTDADGRVSLAEYQAWMAYAFERMDANGDGRLDPDELPGGQGQEVSLARYRESLAAMFSRQDANGDGLLDADELSAPPR